MNTQTILLIEDNPDDAELAQLAFARTGHCNHLEWVDNGHRALAYLEACGDSPDWPALILLDLNLPGPDGLQLLGRLHQWPAYRHTPVVILTTSDEPCDIEAAYRLGVSSYLRKPLDFEHFIALLSETVDYWLGEGRAQVLGHSERLGYL